ncbi:nitric-oxide reductase large subunit [Candidatus Methylocalor cossyra]|uniref:Nitric-oxide reductase, quinol-dependent n=1 Tax=Candidatus Methylocalor cossyra TaxID=3108543 RepID=A0ABP1CAB8_9GAMM
MSSDQPRLHDGSSATLSPAWGWGVVGVLVLGFAVLIWMTLRVYEDAPPIPEKVVDAAGATLFTGEDIRAGQEVFLRYGLMENGTIWGHGAYLGPDFSAQYLHNLVLDSARVLAQRDLEALSAAQRDRILAEIRHLLRTNRYQAESRTLTFTPAEEGSFRRQIDYWGDYFQNAAANRGLPAKYIGDREELRRLTAFFAWTAWASVAQRPGQSYSYTNNFPYDPDVGNTPTADTVLWSALSLVFLLGGTALVLYVFGRYDFLGWRQPVLHVHPRLLPGLGTTDSQRATIKYFVVVALLFLAQTLVGGATAHFRAEPGGFYGFDLAAYLPSHLLRTWHLQLALFWITTAYVAGALFLAPALGGREPEGQSRGVGLLFVLLLVVTVGSLLGEWAGLRQALGRLWFWFGHQGWEYLDLSRGWQILLAAGLVLWLALLIRGAAPWDGVAPSATLTRFFVGAALTIPLFYLPALGFGSRTHFSVVDTWRFWIVHLWVEEFLEFFVTVMVAVIFVLLGLVSELNARRTVYLEAILFSAGGLIGTGHHWYWSGQGNMTIALAAMFSALEVVPLTLLTFEAWDFVQLTRGRCTVCGEPVAIPHRWTFAFLFAVGFWNFVGAGVFGFLINLPIISYFEVGTDFTPNHGHAAMMGVFGMLAIALMVFAMRQVLGEADWRRVEPWIRVAFWGLNIGLALMVILSLFPGGLLQLRDVLDHGYWHARGEAFAQQYRARFIEWLRLGPDLLFILLGAVPVTVAALIAYASVWSTGRGTVSGQ